MELISWYLVGGTSNLQIRCTTVHCSFFPKEPFRKNYLPIFKYQCPYQCSMKENYIGHKELLFICIPYCGLLMSVSLSLLLFFINSKLPLMVNT